MNADKPVKHFMSCFFFPAKLRIILKCQKKKETLSRWKSFKFTP